MQSAATAGAPLRVVIADDDSITRHAIKHVLQADHIVVVGEAADGREAVALARYHRPDLILMDVAMPGMDGVEATRQVARELPSVGVVLFSASVDPELPFVGLRAGAVGYIDKSTRLRALPGALRGVQHGEAALSRTLTRELVDQYRRLSESVVNMRPVRSVLTAREWEVLDALVDGASTQDVADRLFLEPATVRSHVKNILRKLDVSTRADAVAVAQRMRAELPAVA